MIIPAVLLSVFGYALIYTGLGGLSDGVLTGGNKQGLLASLGISPNGLSSTVAFTPAALVTKANTDLGPSTTTTTPTTQAVNA